jgi:SAM-dependent methyltransferase
MNKWEQAQTWEESWHGNCINSFHEEEKQLVYAEKMGLIRTPTPKTPYNFDLQGKSILDIGGGECSLLLKCVNYSNAMVVDPLMSKYPEWVISRYNTANIKTLTSKGEDIKIEDSFDECWIYNVLEHCENPEKVIKNALRLGNIVRAFEWINTTTNIGHIHSLTEEKLNKWFEGEGKVEDINKNGAVGTAWYGIFKGRHYTVSKR